MSLIWYLNITRLKGVFVQLGNQGVSIVQLKRFVTIVASCITNITNVFPIYLLVKTMAISWLSSSTAPAAVLRTWIWSWSSTWSRFSRITILGASTTSWSSKCLGFSTVCIFDLFWGQISRLVTLMHSLKRLNVFHHSRGDHSIEVVCSTFSACSCFSFLRSH